MDFVYRGFMNKFKYKINLVESSDGGKIRFNDLKLSFEKTIHSEENLAVKISDGDKSFCYSGDGSPIENSNFYKDSNLLILETYMYDIEVIGHSSIIGAISFAEKNDVECLALTHIHRDFRRKEVPRLKIKSDKVRVIIPEPFEEYSFGARA